MATIIKRKKNYSIVYNYVDENGNSKQKWETRSSYQDSLKRKTEIESQKVMGNFIPPSNQTIAEFLEDFVSLYGEKRWGLSMYDSQNSLIANYINPEDYQAAALRLQAGCPVGADWKESI